MSNMMPIRRKLKNVVKNYTDAQVKVRDATSNDPWGPSSTLMSEIADATYNVMSFTDIMQMIWKRLNDHGKNWRHVYKSLVLLEYILKTGSEKVAQQCKENIYAIQTLKDFQYMDENKDQGMNVREKAKQLVSLLQDDERLKNERAKALKAKERFAQNSTGISSRGETTHGGNGGGSMFVRSSNSGSAPSLSSGAGGYADPFGGATGERDTTTAARRLSADLEQARPSTAGEEELQLQLALAISKEEADEEQRQRRGDDVRLQLAMEESKKVQEDEGGRRQVNTNKKPTLVDLIGSGATQTQQPTADPWAASQPPAQTDPWSSQPSRTASQPQIQEPWVPAGPPRPVAQPDPWGDNMPGSTHSTPLSTPGQTGDIWGNPAPEPTSTHSSPWGSPAMPAAPTNHTTNGQGFDAFAPQPAVNNTHNIDDAFDMLSSRSPSSSVNPSVTGNTRTSPNPFETSTPAENCGFDAQGKKKTPEDFLGANKNLVNLDNLVGRPSATTPGSTNPFAALPPAAQQSNPFTLQQQQQRVPLNQLQAQSNVGFEQRAPSLPNPLIPVASQQPFIGQPVHTESSNPFM